MDVLQCMAMICGLGAQRLKGRHFPAAAMTFILSICASSLGRSTQKSIEYTETSFENVTNLSEDYYMGKLNANYFAQSSAQASSENDYESEEDELGASTIDKDDDYYQHSVSANDSYYDSDNKTSPEGSRRKRQTTKASLDESQPKAGNNASDTNDTQMLEQQTNEGQTHQRADNGTTQAEIGKSNANKEEDDINEDETGESVNEENEEDDAYENEDGKGENDGKETDDDEDETAKDGDSKKDDDPLDDEEYEEDDFLSDEDDFLKDDDFDFSSEEEDQVPGLEKITAAAMTTTTPTVEETTGIFNNFSAVNDTLQYLYDEEPRLNFTRVVFLRDQEKASQSKKRSSKNTPESSSREQYSDEDYSEEYESEEYDSDDDEWRNYEKDAGESSEYHNQEDKSEQDTSFESGSEADWSHLFDSDSAVDSLEDSVLDEDSLLAAEDLIPDFDYRYLDQNERSGLLLRSYLPGLLESEKHIDEEDLDPLTNLADSLNDLKPEVNDRFKEAIMKEMTDSEEMNHGTKSPKTLPDQFEMHIIDPDKYGYDYLDYQMLDDGAESVESYLIPYIFD